MREEDSKYCFIHGGNRADTTLKELNLYRIKKFEGRLRELKSANAARTIDEELAILRMTLENVLMKCDEEGEMGLLLY